MAKTLKKSTVRKLARPILVREKIESLARRSSKFKIGKTGLKDTERLNGHPDFKNIETITSSKDKKVIDNLEAKMISKFINWKNNSNVNVGSAGEMSDDADKYFLYVVYTKKRKLKRKND